jgi:hypothetical protein
MNVKGDNMRGEWNLREWEKPHWTAFFERKIEELKSGRIEAIDLTKEDLCPQNIIDILEAIGYEYDDFSANGWEQDTDIFLTSEEANLRLFYCGRTFRMGLTLSDEDY